MHWIWQHVSVYNNFSNDDLYCTAPTLFIRGGHRLQRKLCQASCGPWAGHAHNLHFLKAKHNVIIFNSLSLSSNTSYNFTIVSTQSSFSQLNLKWSAYVFWELSFLRELIFLFLRVNIIIFFCLFLLLLVLFLIYRWLSEDLCLTLTTFTIHLLSEC